MLFALIATVLYFSQLALAVCNCSPGVGCTTVPFLGANCDLVSCPVGSYSPGGTAACQICPSGSETNGGDLLGFGASSCTQCPPGFFSTLPGSINCLPAPIGSYVPNAGATLPTLCPLGTYSSSLGQSQCIDCPCGTFADLPGQTVCTPCPRLTVPLTQIGFIGTSPRRSTSIFQCRLCPGGSSTFTDPQADQTIYDPFALTLVYAIQCCTNCPAGSVNSEIQSPTCTVCNAGTAPNSDQTACTAVATAARRKRTLQRCAPGFKSCPIPGRKGLAECLDTRTSLESCGGCPGDTAAQDCSTLENVRSVTCAAGKCQYECLPGDIKTPLGCTKFRTLQQGRHRFD